MRYKLLLFLCLLTLLTACSIGGGATALPTSPSVDASETAQAAATPEPSATTVPTPAPAAVILVAPSESDPAQVDAAKTALTALAAANQLAFQTLPAINPEMIHPEYKILVFLQPPADLPALLAAAPKTQFVVVGGSDLAASANLSVIHQNEALRTFMGGYIATLIAPDWRSLGLVPVAPADMQDAFLNGGRYWCGRCIPVFPPVVLFPLTAAQPDGTGADGWQNAVTQLMAKDILQVIYMSPQAYTPELAKALYAQKLILVGTQPPAPEVKSLWAATLGFDPLPGLKKLWPGLVANQGGQTVDAGLTWTNVNPDLFSPGRQLLAQKTLAGLLDGSIDPLSVPAQ